MIKYIKIKKTIAFFFLSLLTIEILFPACAWALTSGPSQPETKQFVTAGTSDMVDLFSGAFKYDVPIMDIDGYPINLNYQSGVGMDDEASWVGLGWNLNVGAINRQLRGLPDDLKGDTVVTEHYTRPKTTYGGRGTLKMELAGQYMAKLAGSISVGVFSDSYTGIGGEVGGNAGLSFSVANSGTLTGGMGLGLRINSNTSEGVSVTPRISLSLTEKINSVNSTEMGLSASLGYNTRQGLKDLTLSQTFSVKGDDGHGRGESSNEMIGRTYSYNTPGFYPQAGISYKSTNGSYSIDIGGAYFLAFAGGGLTGYYSKREVKEETIINHAYGFMYADRGTQQPKALMDFMREKDVPVVTQLPNLAMPIATPDMFSYSSQAGSGQFRLYRGGSGVLFDAETNDVSTNNTVGLDLGFGTYFHGGVTWYNQDVFGQTSKWKIGNGFLAKGDYPSYPAKKEEDAVYFKRVGEKNISDDAFTRRIQGETLVSVPIFGKTALDGLKGKEQVYTSSSPYKRDSKAPKRNVISWLTAEEAAKGGALDKTIMNVPFQDSAHFSPQACGVKNGTTIIRTDGSRKKHHLSEITVTGDDGKRMVYGLPVYNLKQEEYTFAIKSNATGIIADKNLVPVEYDGFGKIKHKHGIDFSKDDYFHHETQPAYASSYLLTGILSPDYVDVTGDGITDDDLGTAIKFNYSKVAEPYKWRAPYEKDMATLNKGLLADGSDSKGSIIYGEKELWYLQSIETKTKIVYFITEDREDALGVTDWKGGRNTSVRQKRLKEVRLFSKSDLQHPVKTAVFGYDYLLSLKVPNQLDITKGKLKLKSIYFKYGSSTKGSLNPYKFEYGDELNNLNNPDYAHLSTDRWGSYKPQGNNPITALKNDEYPYSLQDTEKANAYARAWNLSKIKLPTGGEITVNYEAGDYAYVQDRKAMEMVKIEGLIDENGATTTNLYEARGFRIKTPVPLAGTAAAQTKFFKEHYLDGKDVLYAKLFTNMTDTPEETQDGLYDFIPTYAKVVKVEREDDNYARVFFEDMTQGDVKSNPFIFSAWQKMRMEYQQYAYPGYKNRITNDRAIEAALGALVNALGNFSELGRNFYERARDNKFAKTVKLDKSFCRIVKTDGVKKGGAARVKQVRISDSWAAMSNVQNTGASYGQEYSYVKKEQRNGKGDQVISSGVACYEPGVGSDENPLRLPVPYTEEMKGTLNNYFYLEEPFGESLYPAAQVGYSSVTVKDLAKDGNVETNPKTGWTVNEFYTAKEFPVLVDYEKRPQLQNEMPANWHSYVGGKVVHEMTMSQGYVVILNDMHGQIKSQRVFNQSGSEVSSVVYHYNAAQIDAGKYRLKNVVTVATQLGTITRNQTIGRELEMVVDMRQQEISNKGKTIQLGFDMIPFIIAVLPVPHWPVRDNDEYRLFRSACVLKTVHYSGVLDKVVKTVNGSSVISSNLVFDQLTGEPVVTQTNNEFDDPVYSVNLPAYWAHSQMGAAFSNQNTILEGFSTDASGVISSTYENFLTAGDELINYSGNGERLWVVYSETNNSSTKELRLIDNAGHVRPCSNVRVKVVRSGFRNQLNSSAASVVCMADPLIGNRLGVFWNDPVTDFKVLDTKAVLYDEKWGMAEPCPDCPTGYTLSADGQRCIEPVISDGGWYLSVVKGDAYIDYGVGGAHFYDQNNVKLGESRSGYWDTTCQIQSFAREMNVEPVKTPAEWDTGRIAVKAAASGEMGLLAFEESRRTCSRLNRAGIWLYDPNPQNRLYDNKWLGFESCFTAAVAGTYSIMASADNCYKIYIDDVLLDDRSVDDASNFTIMRVRAKVLSAGTHRIRMEAKNVGMQAAMVAEVFKVPPSTLLAGNYATAGDNRIFTTDDLPYQSQVYTFINSSWGGMLTSFRCASGLKPDICAVPCNCGSIESLGQTNPYLTGFLGNWRPSEEKVFKAKRIDQNHLSKNTGIDVRNSGAYLSYTPFWAVSGSGFIWSPSTNANWITSRYVTLYDKYGQELENRNALDLYSSALYGYRDALPTAVASNAMARQIFYDGFEDYKFRNVCIPIVKDSCAVDSFDIYSALRPNSVAALNSVDAHTGNYSLKLTTALSLSTIVHNKIHKSEDYLNRSPLGEYVKKFMPGLYPKRFSPEPGGKYMISLWVKNGQAPSTDPLISLTVNNQAVTVTRKATVEGWALVEGEIDFNTIPGSAQGVTFKLHPKTSNVLIDDLRISPVKGMVKTYAYDDKLLKVMAILDENNFATFYEYDDEGTLIRVKKETERGIMTIQESRSAYRITN